MPRRRMRSRGMLMFIVLSIAVLLLIASLALWQANQSETARIPNLVRRMQASYLAKGALQLALLKARLMVTPLYHASAFAVGKNPFYTHAAGYAHLTGGSPATPYVTAPGPAFLTGSCTFNAGDPVRTLVKTIPGESAPSSLGDWDGDGTDELTVDRHLTFFFLDLADTSFFTPIVLNDGAGSTHGETIDGQSSISVSETDNCPKFGSPDPYSGRMRISRMAVMGGKDGRLYREDAVVIVAEAEVTATIAGVLETWRTEEKTIYKATRRYNFGP